MVLSFELPPEQRQALEAAYASPPRAYHHFGHVREVMRHAQDVAGGPGWSKPIAAQLAVLYHDAIYQPGHGDNEARSAQLLREHAARWPGIGQRDLERAAELIEWTARHGQWKREDFSADANGDDTRHFLDCDMAILGASPDEFDAYDRAIAAEYRGVVPAWVFRLKRRGFLKMLLASERIFLSDLFHARYDRQARDNLRRTITRNQ